MYRVLVAPAEVSELCRCKVTLKIRLGFVVGVPFYPLFDNKHYENTLRSYSPKGQWSCSTELSVGVVQKMNLFSLQLFACRGTSGLAEGDC